MINSKTFFLLLISSILLFSCKEKTKFDNSLLEGHWLMDSIYVNIQDAMAIENNNKKFYSFSKDLVYDTQLENLHIDFFNQNFENEIPYNYEIINDSIYLFELFIDTIIKTNTRYKIELLTEKNLIFSLNNNKLFYTKKDFDILIPIKSEFLRLQKNKN